MRDKLKPNWGMKFLLILILFCVLFGVRIVYHPPARQNLFENNTVVNGKIEVKL